jgi:hypothetical protein
MFIKMIGDISLSVINLSSTLIASGLLFELLSDHMKLKIKDKVFKEKHFN